MVRHRANGEALAYSRVDGVRWGVCVQSATHLDCSREFEGLRVVQWDVQVRWDVQVGLGKPVFILPGKGPQFTAHFAEAQTRLLGKSVVLLNSPEELGATAAATMADARALQKIAANGRIRMGGPGGAKRIATAVLDALLW
ncbi:unnamed protein product [Closterium sp. Yama58-4]|nr:unnamed protein product [Closterium sp. Yama58-4]